MPPAVFRALLLIELRFRCVSHDQCNFRAVLRREQDLDGLPIRAVPNIALEFTGHGVVACRHALRFREDGLDSTVDGSYVSLQALILVENNGLMDKVRVPYTDRKQIHR